MHRHALARSPAARAILAILLATAALRAPAAQTVYHVLVKGETLYSVARSYGLSVDAIAAANGISDPLKVKIGQRLIIPSLHKVAKGETLFGIAKDYGIGIEELRAVNKLKSQAVIKVGDALLIPGGGPAIAGTAGANPGPGQAPGSADPPPLAGSGPSTGPSTGQSTGQSTGPGTVAATSLPATMKVSPKTVDRKVSWPCAGDPVYLDGKLFGVMIRSRQGEAEKAVASGSVVSAGPYRGYGQVVFIQSRGGLIYIYGGNDSLGVKVGEQVRSGQELGKVGPDLKEGGGVAYFFVFKNGEAVDPAVAPRD